MPQREPESDWAAEVHDVDSELAHPKLVEQAVDHLGEVVERVREGRPVRHSAVPECRIVGRDDVVSVCSTGISLRNIRDDDGKPCSRSSTGASGGPASR